MLKTLYDPEQLASRWQFRFAPERFAQDLARSLQRVQGTSGKEVIHFHRELSDVLGLKVEQESHFL